MNCGPTHHFGCACHEKQWQEKLEKAERERDEAREAYAAETKSTMDMAGKIASLERERDNAITDAKQFEVDCIRALHERNEARAQRDQLASLLSHLKDKDWFQDGTEGPVTCTLDAGKVRDALAGVKGGGK